MAGVNVKNCALIAAIIALQGCTVARYTDDSHSLTVIDLHPTGNSVLLDASLTGKGQVSLNRTQGSTEGIVDSVVDAVTPSIIDGL